MRTIKIPFAPAETKKPPRLCKCTILKFTHHVCLESLQKGNNEKSENGVLNVITFYTTFSFSRLTVCVCRPTYCSNRICFFEHQPITGPKIIGHFILSKQTTMWKGCARGAGRGVLFKLVFLNIGNGRRFSVPGSRRPTCFPWVNYYLEIFKF